MRISPERRAWLKAETLRRIIAAPESDRRRFFLCECVQAYLPLEGPQLEEFNNLLVTEKYMAIQQVGTTWFEQGIETGIVRGQLRTLRKLLEKRFGPLSPAVLTRLEAFSEVERDRITVQLLDARSLAELGLDETQLA